MGRYGSTIKVHFVKLFQFETDEGVKHFVQVFHFRVQFARNHFQMWYFSLFSPTFAYI